MRLSELADRIPGSRVIGPGDVDVGRAVHDSRRVRAGDLFVALAGTKIDGARRCFWSATPARPLPWRPTPWPATRRGDSSSAA